MHVCTTVAREMVLCVAAERDRERAHIQVEREMFSQALEWEEPQRFCTKEL